MTDYHYPKEQGGRCTQISNPISGTRSIRFPWHYDSGKHDLNERIRIELGIYPLLFHDCDFNVDLENANGLSSSAIAGLVSMIKQCKKREKKVVLRNVQPLAKDVIDATKLVKKGPLEIEESDHQ